MPWPTRPARWSRAAAADGMQHPAIAAAAPFDLILANILAGPLTRLAPDIGRAVAPGGHAGPVRAFCAGRRILF